MRRVVSYCIWLCAVEAFDVNIGSKIIDRPNTISWSVFAAIPFQQQDEKQKILVEISLEERLGLGLRIL